MNAIQNAPCVQEVYNRTQLLGNISQQSGKKVFYLIDVRRPGGDYVAHVMLNYRATILLKETSKSNACPVCYLPVIAFTIAKTMKRGKLDRFTVKIAHWCWIARAEHPKPELRSAIGLLLLPAEQGSHGCALREAQDSIKAPHLRDCAFKVGI